MAILSFRSKSKSFTEFLEENKLKFYKTAKIILKNDDDIYDALQDALLSMYKSYDTLRDKKFNKMLEIPVDLSKATEKVEKNINLKEYKADTYKIKYNANWNLIPKVDTTRVGPNSMYLGALELEIPSTTNSEYTSSIYVKVTNENTTIDNFASKIRKENTNSVSEHFEEKSSSEIKLKNQNGYTIVSTTTDGEENYIKQDIYTIVHGKVYRIIFFGSEKEYNNLQEELNSFISNFEI